MKKSSNNNIFFLSNRDKKDINKVISPNEVGYRIEKDLEWIFYSPEKEKLVDIFKENFQWDQELNNFIDEAEKVSYATDIEGKRTALQRLAAELSSGQKIILSIITSLINYASENSLFIIDEPEAYLHAPYVLSIISTINDIVREENSIALIATHSSIVIQELTKKKCLPYN
ncbi:hypothetical protein AAX19_02305 [Oenococcus oeni]|nr:hypothetical protein AAX19_02305 [Oenococcus oeni]